MSDRRLRILAALRGPIPFLAWLAIGAAAPSIAHAGFLDRLLGERLAPVEDGAYLAGDKIGFGLVHAGKNILLRFDGDPEVFVLSQDRTSLGARVLKYDSGETAIRVAGWGALTLYTDEEPNGLPAGRTGDAPPMTPSPVSLQDVQFVAAQEAARFERLRHLRIAFVVDWSVLETSADMRATASEALENAAAGLEKTIASREGRRSVAKRIDKVTLATARRPGLRLEDKTLIVTFNPERGYAGCASSRAVERALAVVLTKKSQRAAKD